MTRRRESLASCGTPPLSDKGKACAVLAFELVAAWHVLCRNDGASSAVLGFGRQRRTVVPRTVERVFRSDSVLDPRATEVWIREAMQRHGHRMNTPSAASCSKTLHLVGGPPSRALTNAAQAAGKPIWGAITLQGQNLVFCRTTIRRMYEST